MFWVQLWKATIAAGLFAWIIFAALAAGHPLPPQVDIQTEQRISRDEIGIERNTQKTDEIERRLNSMDGQKIDQRLTRMETISEYNHEMLTALLGGVLLLLVEAAVRFTKMVRKSP